jgi:hypothetical protein
MNDSVIFMINKGIGLRGWRQMECGRAYIAAFDVQTGARKYFTIIDKEAGSIIHFKVFREELYLLFLNKIAKYNIQTGTQISEAEFSKEDVGKVRFFIGDQVFIDNKHDHFFSLVQNDSTNLHILTLQDEIISVNKNLDVMHALDREDAYVNYLDVKNYRFIGKHDKTFIINNYGKKIAELDVSLNAVFDDNILYEKKDKSFIIIDLKNIINDE